MKEILDIQIKDIMVSDLFFYDRDEEQACLEFCKIRGISFLPDLSRKCYYRMEQDGFHQQELTNESFLCSGDSVFEQEVFNKFKKDKDNVLFVTEEEKIVGVVHICDYNSEQMFIHIYKYYMQYELNLRRLLEIRGKRNDDVIEFLGSSSSDIYRRRSVEIKTKLGGSRPFEKFFITELFAYAKHAQLFENDINEGDVVNLIRKKVAHFHSAVLLVKSAPSP